ncbi:MAG: 23S rRNA (guanosine(2251)-2'-O)-methyltransferase RlmB [Rickettsiella sp.]|nr:23S rRNA (guanosine(2251)-2'-O)-methyltransferase RlmB [Rickettsiella sp.]
MSKKEFIFGFHAVTTILNKAPERVLQLFRQEGRNDQRIQSIIQLAKNQHIPQQILSKLQLDKKAEGGRHQGILIEVNSLPVKDDNYLFSLIENLTKPAFLLVLDEIQDPHNLGACLRSANAADVDAVIITQHRSVGLTSTVRKIASGAAETTPLITVTNLASTLKKLKKVGIWIYGLEEMTTQSIYNTDLTGPLGLVLGAEGKGLRHLTRELCDGLITIPMHGTVESLNVSVAAGVCLFEAFRQRL